MTSRRRRRVSGLLPRAAPSLLDAILPRHVTSQRHQEDGRLLATTPHRRGEERHHLAPTTGIDLATTSELPAAVILKRSNLKSLGRSLHQPSSHHRRPLPATSHAATLGLKMDISTSFQFEWKMPNLHLDPNIQLHREKAGKINRRESARREKKARGLRILFRLARPRDGLLSWADRKTRVPTSPLPLQLRQALQRRHPPRSTQTCSGSASRNSKLS